MLQVKTVSLHLILIELVCEKKLQHFMLLKLSENCTCISRCFYDELFKKKLNHELKAFFPSSMKIQKSKKSDLLMIFTINVPLIKYYR